MYFVCFAHTPCRLVYFIVSLSKNWSWYVVWWFVLYFIYIPIVWEWTHEFWWRMNSFLCVFFLKRKTVTIPTTVKVQLDHRLNNGLWTSVPVPSLSCWSHSGHCSWLVVIHRPWLYSSHWTYVTRTFLVTTNAWFFFH